MKKITRNTLITLVSIGGVLAAVVIKAFLGNTHVNLSKVNPDKNQNVSPNIELISAANADLIPPCDCDTTPPCECNSCDSTMPQGDGDSH